MSAQFLVSLRPWDKEKIRHMVYYFRHIGIPFSYLDSIVDVEDLLTGDGDVTLINDSAVGPSFGYTQDEISSEHARYLVDEIINGMKPMVKANIKDVAVRSQGDNVFVFFQKGDTFEPFSIGQDGHEFSITIDDKCVTINMKGDPYVIVPALRDRLKAMF